MFKALLVLLCVIAIIEALSLQLGQAGPDDLLLYFSADQKQPIEGVSQNEEIKYIGNKNITQIRVTDLFTNGTGGTPTIISGGLYQFSATIRLASSQPGRGYSFRTDIYGN